MDKPLIGNRSFQWNSKVPRQTRTKTSRHFYLFGFVHCSVSLSFPWFLNKVTFRQLLTVPVSKIMLGFVFFIFPVLHLVPTSFVYRQLDWWRFSGQLNSIFGIQYSFRYPFPSYLLWMLPFYSVTSYAVARMLRPPIPWSLHGVAGLRLALVFLVLPSSISGLFSGSYFIPETRWVHFLFFFSSKLDPFF